jgi:cytochrome b involved in lipid metabolism
MWTFETIWITICITSLLIGSFVFLQIVPITKENKMQIRNKQFNFTSVEIKSKYTSEDVARHNKPNDCWIIVDGKVYDVTSYILDHPGGESILNNAGRDSSIGVHGPQHPESIWDVLNLFYIGELEK